MNENSLRRYTDIPGLIYLLSRSAITLLDPSSWDDLNDSYYLNSYKTQKGLARVLALCFTEAAETYHHWRVFAGGASGVCVRFNRSAFLKVISKFPAIRAQPVKYRTLPEAGAKAPAVEELPFLKRIAFEPENEFRLVFASAAPGEPTKDVPISLSCIERVSLSPWMPKALAEEVKPLLKAIKGCRNLEIVRSSLINNERWKRFGDRAMAAKRRQRYKS